MLTEKDLTAGERLFLVRRRFGRTQAQAARLLGTSLYTYRKWEKDEETAPPVFLGSLEAFEICVVLRRRSEVPSVLGTANLVGISKWWLRRMERGDAPADRLTQYWNLT